MARCINHLISVPLQLENTSSTPTFTPHLVASSSNPLIICSELLNTQSYCDRGERSHYSFDVYCISLVVCCPITSVDSTCLIANRFGWMHSFVLLLCALSTNCYIFYVLKSYATRYSKLQYTPGSLTVIWFLKSLDIFSGSNLFRTRSDHFLLDDLCKMSDRICFSVIKRLKETQAD